MTFKILSLDGGGIRGVISARLLQEVERQLWESKGLRLHEYFDLIAGTSTGSILAAGIAKGLTTDKLLKLYEDNAAQIFPYKNSKLIAVLEGIKDFLSNSKYTHDGLIKSLQKPEALADTKIADIQYPLLLILAYDMRYRNTTFFTNFHPDIGLRWYDGLPLWQLCVSSASAPTFFPPTELKASDPKVFGDWSFPHIDGGVAANNPSLAAIAQVMKLSRSPAVTVEDKQKYHLENLKMEDISVLSIGTGRSGEPYEYEQIKKWNTLDWVKRVVDVFMEPTGEINATICKHILGGFESGRYLRLEFDLNERYKSKTLETHKDARLLVAAKERINQFTGKPLSEAMDDARADNVQNLIAAAEAFIEQGLLYNSRVYGEGPQVKEAITKYLGNN